MDSEFSFSENVTANDTHAVTQKLTSMYLKGQVDKIELIYTNCNSSKTLEPAIRTILPLEPTGMENELDELFTLAEKDGQFKVLTMDEKLRHQSKLLVQRDEMIFEQDPSSILNSIMPLYLNSQVLRAV